MNLLKVSMMWKWIKFFWRIFLANCGQLKAPFRLFLVVTKSCQSRCQNCKIWTEKVEGELTLENYLHIARQSPFLSWLNISGGEPTDRDDLPEIIHAFVKNCPDLIFVNFTTNGLNPKRIISQVESISKLGIPWLNINVSIDGPKDLHEKLRGVPGNFDTALATLKGLKKIQKVTSRAAMTLFSENANHVSETIIAIQSVIPSFNHKDLHLNLPHQSEHYYRNHIIQVKTSIDIFDIFKKHTRQVLTLRLDSWIEFQYRRWMQTYIKTKKSPLNCSALMSSIYLSEKGTLYPCTIWNENLGALKDFDWNILKAQQSTPVKEARLKIIEKKCPNCWTPCEAYTTILSNLSKV